MLVADGSRLQKVVGIFFCLGLGDVLLDVLVEAHCLVQVDGSQIIEINVVVYLSQLLDLLLGQHLEGLLLGDQRIAQEAALTQEYMRASMMFSPGL